MTDMPNKQALLVSFEHVARPLVEEDLVVGDPGPALAFRGNFRGFLQYRKELPFEENYAAALASIAEIDT